MLAILVAALIAAFAFAITVSRSLQSQIQRLLKAARQMTQTMRPCFLPSSHFLLLLLAALAGKMVRLTQSPDLSMYF